MLLDNKEGLLLSRYTLVALLLANDHIPDEDYGADSLVAIRSLVVPVQSNDISLLYNHSILSDVLYYLPCFSSFHNSVQVQFSGDVSFAIAGVKTQLR